MKKRLVLVACKDTHRTNWMRATGTEQKIRVGGLGDGDVVELVLAKPTGELASLPLSCGEQPMPEGPWLRYMISKVSQPPTLPTTVEIDLG